MKYIHLFIIGLMGAGILASCYEDKGNYNYKWIPEYTIEMSVSDTTIARGDTLVVSPVIWKNTFSDDRATILKREVVTNYDDFEYEWIAYDSRSPTSAYFLSTKRDLDEPVYINTSTSVIYIVQLKLTEKATGISSYGAFNTRVLGKYTRKFLFLIEDGEGNVEMDLYGTTTDGRKAIEKDILKRTEFPYTTGGANAILYQKFPTTGTGAKIWVAAGSGTSWLDPENLGYSEVLGNLNLLFLPRTSDTFTKIARTYGSNTTATNNFYYFISPEGNFHFMTLYGTILPNLALIGMRPVEVSHAASDRIMCALVWNKTDKEFAYASCYHAGSSYPATSLTPVAGEGSAQGMECVYIGSTLGTGAAVGRRLVAVAKSNDTHWLYYFDVRNFGSGMDYVYRPDLTSKTELSGTAALGKIDHMINDRYRGSIYAAVGNKLYNFREYENKWIEVRIFDANNNPVQSTDLITHLHVEDFSSTLIVPSLTRCFYMATYSETNGGKVYVLEPYDTESVDLRLIELMQGNSEQKLGNIKGITMMGY